MLLTVKYFNNEFSDFLFSALDFILLDGADIS